MTEEEKQKLNPRELIELAREAERSKYEAERLKAENTDLKARLEAALKKEEDEDDLF